MKTDFLLMCIAAIVGILLGLLLPSPKIATADEVITFGSTNPKVVDNYIKYLESQGWRVLGFRVGANATYIEVKKK